MRKKGLIIAIDGYSSCGKSTMARDIAARLDYVFIDTGAMYRAITYALMQVGLADSDETVIGQALDGQVLDFAYSEKHGKNVVFLNGECVEDAIRSKEVTANVSRVSALASVRERLVAMQQEIGREGGVVMDGRDIGTEVFPDAEIKVFMTASDEVRGQRRYAEQMAKGDNSSSLEEVTADLKKRDYDDENREISPLRKADDAVVLDNSEMSIEEQMHWFLALYNARK